MEKDFAGIRDRRGEIYIYIPASDVLGSTREIRLE
jgi:hypothetical protein